MINQVQTVLDSLPPYGDYGCSDSDCTIPAVVRHPQTGKFYCAGHAWARATEHQVEMEDIALVVGIRRRLLDEGWKCDFCDKPAERICSYEQERICFDHYHLIPRTGAACPDCALVLEREEEAKNYWG
jgi:hypothetical protein